MVGQLVISVAPWIETSEGEPMGLGEPAPENGSKARSITSDPGHAASLSREAVRGRDQIVIELL